MIQCKLSGSSLVKGLSSFRYKALWIGLALASALTFGAIAAIRYVGAGLANAVDFKSAKTTTGTVVSAIQDAKKQQFRVCFTIDNFDQLEPNIRRGYESAEAQRLAKDGPQCQSATKVALAARLVKGDKLSVVYLLENGYQIEVVKVAAFGQDLRDYR